MICQAAFAQIFGLEYTIFRPHNVYGERQNVADRYRNVINIFMNRALQGKPMPVFGDGRQTRASRTSMTWLGSSRGRRLSAGVIEVYNIGADTPYTILELADAIGRAFGIRPVLEHLPPHNEVVHAYSDHSKVRAAFKPPKPLDLETGIRRMADWVREHGPRNPVEFAGQIEIERNLPSSWVR